MYDMSNSVMFGQLVHSMVVAFRIRQLGVLSPSVPCLFICIVDLVNQVKLCGFGCYIRCTSII